MTARNKYLISTDTRTVGDGVVEITFVSFHREFRKMEKFQDERFELLDPDRPESRILASLLCDHRAPCFALGKFTLSSGIPSIFKIDCEKFNNDEIMMHAFLASRLMAGSQPLRASKIVSIPKGGDRLAQVLNDACRKDDTAPIYIVDDVYTTGASMKRMRAELNEQFPNADIRGVVLYARGPVPDWVQAVFNINNKLWGL